ncbi:MAG: hypothetical protein Q7W45_08795 [Bacteroidota bacterium]|nr:hypothetical protein [Bacteroidota bacterium]MDP3144225.1 hypothetical protein [Bacteroidota bacterium]
MSLSDKPKEIHHCPVCHSSCNQITELFTTITGASLKKINGFILTICSNCGFCEINNTKKKTPVNNLNPSVKNKNSLQ